MNRLGELLGSNTRGNIVEALALSGKPLTAYRVAKTYNMNVAKAYNEMKRLERLGMVKTVGKARWREYALADMDLKSLALRLSSRVQTYASWSSGEAKRERFRMGMTKVPRLVPTSLTRVPKPAGRRMPGELENLARLGRWKFDSKYRRVGAREYVHV